MTDGLEHRPSPDPGEVEDRPLKAHEPAAECAAADDFDTGDVEGRPQEGIGRRTSRRQRPAWPPA